MPADSRPDHTFGTIPKMVRANAERFGGADAVVDGDRRLSFATVADEMLSVAGGLIAAGIRRGDRVAIWAPNSAAWISAALGVQAVGAWLVPLNTRLTGIEASYILEKTDASALFAADGFLGNDYTGALRDAAPHLRALRNTIQLPLPGESTTPGWADLLAAGTGAARDRAEDAMDAGHHGDVSDIIFTSGTTAAPKGVMLRHGASLRGYALLADRFGLRAGDRYLIPTPFFHCFGYKAGWMISLMTGAVAVPLSVFDAGAVLKLIARERITHIPGPPTMFSALLDHPDRDSFDLSSLRHAFVGATAVAPQLIARIRDELGIGSILTAYGLTENHALVSLTAADDPADIVATTAGRPLPDIEVRVVDDDGVDVPTGQQGELLVRSPFAMSAYFGEQEQTAKAIVDGWLHTGDVGTMDDRGYLRITDRKKDIFIVGGFNVAPAEVEKALLEMDSIAQVAVVGMPDDYFGEVGAAFVIPHASAQVRADDVIAYARGRLAGYKVPRSVEFVDALPLNATGKVLKNELRQRIRRLGCTTPG
jgi:acyl-CoA synthetase (AMP-forming)/AMP-acid ligase II